MEAPGRKTSHVFAEGAMFVLSFGVCFFTAGPALFSDGSIGEAYAVVPVEALAVLALCLVAGALGPARWRASARWASYGAIVTPVFFTLTDRLWQDVQMLILAIVLALGAVAAAHLGAWAGAALRMRFFPPKAVEPAADDTSEEMRVLESLRDEGAFSPTEYPNARVMMLSTPEEERMERLSAVSAAWERFRAGESLEVDFNREKWDLMSRKPTA